MEVRKLVGLNLRRLRTALKLPQDDLAVDADIDRAHVSRIERGEENPTILALAKLAKALNAPITEFFREPKRGAPPPPTLKRGRKSRRS